MNLSIQDEFYLFAEELQRYLSPHILQQLAQETGFVKRKSKYGARDLAPIYPSSGGCAQTAGIKIQLEYDLHSGKFLNFQMDPGENNDKIFGTDCLDTLCPGDLCIRDLGYFHLKDLQHIQDKKAYYISGIKSNTRIYQKNPNPDYFQDGRIKKGTEYIQIDMEVLMNSLQPGQTCEISNAFVGMVDLRCFHS